MIQVKETCLYSLDLERAEEFYSGKLGFYLYQKVTNRHLFYTLGSTMLLIFNPEVTAVETKLPSHSANGPMHIAFEVALEEYGMWKEKLIQSEIDIIAEYPWGSGLKSFYFRDPDGHLLEIVPAGIWPTTG